MTDIGERDPEAAELPLRTQEGEIDPVLVARVEDAIETDDGERLRALLADCHAADVADVLAALGQDLRPRLVTLMGPDFDFEALTELDETMRVRIVEALPKETLVEGMRDLDVDDAVYILEDLPDEEQAEILEQLPAVERAVLERSLDYPEGSVGRRMRTEFVAVPSFWTVGQTIDHLRSASDLPDDFAEILVVDPAYHLIGTVRLDRLLRSKRPVRLETILDEDYHRLPATAPQSEAAWLFERYNLLSNPVVDENGRLVGLITVEAVVDVIEEEVDEDLKALGGVTGDEELSDTVAYTVRSRFLWLFVNLATAILASVVISLFEGALQKMVALAVLMPIVASMGGNAGTQTMTVAVRAIATRAITSRNAWSVVRREMLVGALNGLIFALIMGLVAGAWFQSLGLGVVIGLAMVVVLTAAALGGVLIPLALNRLGVDPAVSSGPFVTTVTDVVGFLAFLGIATLWFSFG